MLDLNATFKITLFEPLIVWGHS